MKTIKKNNTWEVTSLPEENKANGVKWVYKEKKNASGRLDRYKARLVAKGCSQRMELITMKCLLLLKI